MKKTTLVSLFSIFLFSTDVVSANNESSVYPSAWPFGVDDAISQTIATYPVSTPPHTFDDEDEGGYSYYGFLASSYNVNEPRIRLIPDQNSTSLNLVPQHHWALTYYSRKNLNLDQFSQSITRWNCSDPVNRKPVFDKNFWVGDYNGKTMCTECCNEFWGLHMNYLSADEFFFGQTVGNGLLCSMPDPTVWCANNNGRYFMCSDRLISKAERKVVLACPDGTYEWMVSCKLSMLGISTVEIESPNYGAQLTNTQELLSTLLTRFSGDRVCHPVSYYAALGISVSTAPEHSMLPILFTAMFPIAWMINT